MGLRDAIVNMVPEISTITRDPTRLRNLAYLCTPLSSVTDPYQLVTKGDDIALYTDDQFIIKAFSEGLSQVYLVFDGNIVDDYTILNQLCYTMLIQPGLAPAIDDYTTFDGLTFLTQDEPTSLTLPNDVNVPALEALKYKEGIFYAPVNEGLFVKVLSNMISPDLNPNWSSLQLKEYPNDTALIHTKEDAERAYEKQFSFLGSDIDMPTPFLMYLRAGGFNVADYYIAENVRQDIQTNIINYIRNFTPNYTNPQIGAIVTRANLIINSYVNRGLIESGKFTLPAKQYQKTIDIINGMVDGILLDVVIGGAIWRSKGTTISRIGGL